LTVVSRLVAKLPPEDVATLKQHLSSFSKKFPISSGCSGSNLTLPVLLLIMATNDTQLDVMDLFSPELARGTQRWLEFMARQCGQTEAHLFGDVTSLSGSQARRMFHGRNYILHTTIPSNRILGTAPTLKEPRVMTGFECLAVQGVPRGILGCPPELEGLHDVRPRWEFLHGLCGGSSDA